MSATSPPRAADRANRITAANESAAGAETAIASTDIGTTTTDRIGTETRTKTQSADIGTSVTATETMTTRDGTGSDIAATLRGQRRSGRKK